MQGDLGNNYSLEQVIRKGNRFIKKAHRATVGFHSRMTLNSADDFPNSGTWDLHQHKLAGLSLEQYAVHYLFIHVCPVALNVQQPGAGAEPL